jgi:hypothetical protein
MMRTLDEVDKAGTGSRRRPSLALVRLTKQHSDWTSASERMRVLFKALMEGHGERSDVRS